MARNLLNILAVTVICSLIYSVMPNYGCLKLNTEKDTEEDESPTLLSVQIQNSEALNRGLDDPKLRDEI